MDSENYSATLTDPRWQRKRLEIFQRDNFTCLECGANDKTLHVHHRKYKPNTQPWDYPDDNFHTLCWECHEKKGNKRFPAKTQKTYSIYQPYRPRYPSPITFNPKKLRKVQQEFIDKQT